MIKNNIEAKIPSGLLKDKWENYKSNSKPINPANKRKFHIIIIGSGLAGASAATSLGELGYKITCFCFQDSPRRAHSIAAQGGINAGKNYPNDGDSVHRLFYDTIKGGDFRAREANVYRLAEISNQIIDHCVAQGVPFARDYAGYLDNRSFGGSLVSRTFYARGQTGQQLLLGAYSGLSKQIASKNVKMHTRCEMQNLVVINGHAKGIVVRNLETGEIFTCKADAIVIASGGYSPVFYLSTNAVNCNVNAAFSCYKKNAYFANPCYTQIHPTCIPVAGSYQSKLTLMSESLRNDGRVWAPKIPNDKRASKNIPNIERDYYLERKYPSFGNLTPRDIASRSAKQVCDENRGVGKTGLGVYLDFQDSIKKFGETFIKNKYGNLFHMYQKITNENPYEVPMRIYPAPHYTMGGLWVDYELMSNIPGLFVLGEANFSDHGANRLGASALMQGLADGYFILPYTIANYLNSIEPNSVSGLEAEFEKEKNIAQDNINKLININGKKTPDYYHKELGKIMWNNCGMARTEKKLKTALKEIPALRKEFWNNVKIPSTLSFNNQLEKGYRVASFLEFAELMCYDALNRKESCGGHFREEYQTKTGEAVRDDKNYQYVAMWQHQKNKPILLKEKLEFTYIQPSIRSYK